MFEYVSVGSAWEDDSMFSPEDFAESWVGIGGVVFGVFVAMALFIKWSTR